VLELTDNDNACDAQLVGTAPALWLFAWFDRMG
jgi:hypothetical protein